MDGVARPDAEVQPVDALSFSLSIFLSAFLLFQVQPMMARYILPWFGGGPAVWTVCLLFFQVLLLAGYAYAHWLGSRTNVKLQVWMHVALLAGSLWFLPIHPSGAVWKPVSSADPSGRILLLLGATVGGPYFLLSATGPLLQRWLTLREPSKLPWRFYALSNFGSLLALLSYPFAVEPYLKLDAQVGLWSALYAAFAVLCGWTAWRFRPVALDVAGPESVSDEAAWPSVRTVLFWVALSACSSTLLVATTNQVSQEIAVNPFLWVAPLAIYLLAFVLAFESDRFYQRALFAVAAGVLAPAGSAMPSLSGVLTLRAQLAVYLAALFATCMLCHGELAKSRPAPRHLTSFYLAIAAGGALGGVFVALIAPRVFTEFTEYPAGLAAACLLGFLGWLRTGALAQWTRRNFGVRVPLMALLFGGVTAIVAAATSGSQPSVASSRNFYGILRVIERTDGNGPLRELRHGRTRHGFQYLDGPQHRWPTSYYGPHSGVAIALNALERANRRIAIVGLGAGTLAAWGRPGDTFRFYEINPDVEAIAHRWFTFLDDSKARTETVLGDARIQFERELAAGRSQDFDLIAVDAFTSDAIPFHLLTAECADLYRRRLAPGGLLLLHISNRVLNLEPVARGLAAHLGWSALVFVSGDDAETGESSSKWVLLSGDSQFLARSGLAARAAPWTHRTPILWTDDFVSLWHVLNF
ncbi:MAG TPA: fused MFS/spermidine synthase [Bryobacteraceae bacterium]|nr:fused MFS/spermidine synthase [Bryobacteraceae bacterium]